MLLLLSGSVVYAQDFIVNPTERTDTNLIKSYLKKSKDFLDTHPDSSYYYLNQAMIKSYTANYSKGIIGSLTELAAFHFGSSTDLSIKYGNMAMVEYYARNSPNFNNVLYRLYNILAKAYETKGLIDSSARYFYLMNDVIEDGKIPAKSYFALSLYTQLAFFWLNTNWDINGGYIEPTQYFINKARIADEGTRDSISDLNFVTYALQGAYYYSIGNYDSSLYCQQEYMRLRVKHKLNNATWDAATYLNIAECYMYLNQPAKALEYIHKELALKEALASNVRYLALGYLALSKAYFMQKDFGRSVATFENVWTMYDPADFQGREMIEACGTAADAYAGMGNLAKALEYKNTYIRLKDSLMKSDKVDMVNRLQIKYRISEKDKALAQQKLATTQAENSVRQRNIWIAGISVLTLAIAALFVLWQRNNRQKQHLQQEKINSFQQQIEIAQLNATIEGEERERSRIARELHDGIGGLMAGARMNFEMIKKTHHLENEKDYQDGLHLLEEASSELRKTAHNMMPEILLQEGLVVAVEYFCSKVASNSPTRIFFQTSGTVRSFNPQFELTIYRTIQELVHNILKHSKATEALVQMGFSDTIFDVTVEDNGIGMPSDIMETAKGMGLKSIADRIKALNGRLEIQNLPDSGTSIYIEVSLEQQNQAS
ncbi:two-component sensor histidine kinase [Filimonas lacunae]|nr:two-component sensor histidine kinase [Filimonas lacunae]